MKPQVSINKQKILRKDVNIFLPISFNKCFGCSKEPSHRDGSFEYPQHMFWLRNKKSKFSLHLTKVLWNYPVLQIVALPYNTLLHQSTREASGIQLKDNIIVIDEAHNLLETINNVHSVEITGAQVCFQTEDQKFEQILF